MAVSLQIIKFTTGLTMAIEVVNFARSYRFSKIMREIEARDTTLPCPYRRSILNFPENRG